MKSIRTIALGLGLLLAPRAQATDPVDLGLLRNSEIQVVQRRLHPVEDRTEVGVFLGVLPFDPYTIAPKFQLTYGHHLSQTLGWEVQLGGGYGIANQTYRTLDSPAYGKVPEAYRYLGSLTGGLEWTPIYAKFNWKGERVFHHDIYFPLIAGVTVEQTVDSNLVGTALDRMAISPTLGVGVGSRVFLHRQLNLRIELRDDWMLQHRAGTDTWALKQNLGVHVGLTRLLGDS